MAKLTIDFKTQRTLWFIVLKGFDKVGLYKAFKKIFGDKPLYKLIQGPGTKNEYVSKRWTLNNVLSNLEKE